MALDLLNTGDRSGWLSSGGVVCPNCGVWTPHSTAAHVCFRPFSGTVYWPTLTTIERGRLLELEQAERKLKEIKRLLEE